MGSCLSSLPDIQKNIISLFCISLLTQDVYSRCNPRVCEATERQFKYVRFPQLGCIWWARAPWGVYSHSHQFSLSLLLCVWHIGSPCCLGWHCVTLLCVCVCERECEKKSRGKKNKKRKKASVPSGTNMGLVVQLTHKCWLESRISDTPKKTKMWCHDVDFKLRKWVSNFNDQNQK